MTEGESRRLVGRWLARQDFAECLEQQLRARDAIIEGTGPEILFMVEHPPTLTLGRRGKREDVLWTDEQLAAEQVAVCETPRGGEVTLHAPGQLVAYPVIRVGRRIREHIVRMAEVTIALFEQLGVDGVEFRMDHPGVWRGQTKMASIGLHISRGVSVQGMSINVDVAPKLFGALVSCGLPEVSMTSVSAIRPEPLPPMAELARRWAFDFAARAGYELEWT
ncbi:Octanoyltransferase [Enhygromyxa salina]|uniref:lipoyl(octanoyl) transferase n=1 Tax=Enhygromyxa salina TaxID=215803 RepID=A0A2S9XDY7_9BACT|nr:lipoyl(octanoyl) transferase LipB [Enhygromyxa salina]PRP91067.1 Octanoyltransferase [Enhygromyxa salina]